MKTVEYSPEAEKDLLLLKDSILAQYGEQVAARILTRITNCIRHLGLYETAGIRVSAMNDVKSDYICRRYRIGSTGSALGRIESKYFRGPFSVERPPVILLQPAGNYAIMHSE